MEHFLSFWSHRSLSYFCNARIIHGSLHARRLCLLFRCCHSHSMYMLKPNPCKFFMARRCRCSCSFSFSFSVCSYIIISSYTLSRTWECSNRFICWFFTFASCVCLCVISPHAVCCASVSLFFLHEEFSYYIHKYPLVPIHKQCQNLLLWTIELSTDICCVHVFICVSPSVYHDVCLCVWECVCVYLLYKMQKIGLVESIDFHSLSLSLYFTLGTRFRALTLRCLPGSRKLIFTQIYITMGSVKDFLCSKSRI